MLIWSGMSKAKVEAQKMKLLTLNQMLMLLLLLLQTFYSCLDFVRDYSVSWYQKGKTKTNLDFLEQETVSSSGISWAMCKSALAPNQITMQAPHHSVFYRPDAPPCHPTNCVKALKALYQIIFICPIAIA